MMVLTLTLVALNSTVHALRISHIVGEPTVPPVIGNVVDGTLYFTRIRIST